MKRFSKYAALALLTASFAAPIMADSDGVTPQDVKQKADEAGHNIEKNSKDAAHRTKRATKRAGRKAKKAGNDAAADIQKSKDDAKAQWEKDHPASTPNP